MKIQSIMVNSLRIIFALVLPVLAESSKEDASQEVYKKEKGRIRNGEKNWNKNTDNGIIAFD
jgi:hypothetical protein